MVDVMIGGAAGRAMWEVSRSEGLCSQPGWISSVRANAVVQASLMPLQKANGTQLYYELRGNGPPLLLIMGATGYGGVFARFADLLADEFTVVMYDRRGNARSPKPAGWTETSPEQQADDAAALLAGLGLAPAAIFATSSAGIFALALLIRHPDAVRGAVLHEPALFALFDDPDGVRARVAQLVGQAMEEGGPATAFERFLRFGAGDANWERLQPEVQKRMLASCDTYFGVESGAFDSYLPDAETLSSITIPITLVVSEHSHAFFAQAAARLAQLLGVDIARTPGTHFPYLDHPQALAQAVRPFLRRLSPARTGLPEGL